jgi:hypothetical protein
MIKKVNRMADETTNAIVAHTQYRKAFEMEPFVRRR